MMPIAGYADRLSVRPGETIAFKVSSQLKGAYNAHLVRIVSGDANPKGPGLVEHKIEAPFAGAHPSRNQPVHQGSYARIDAGVDLSGAAGLTFVATIWPTTPGNKRQGIMSAYDPNVRLGFALAILLVPLVLYRPAGIEYRIYAPSPLLERVVRELGGARTLSVEEALARCDPSWAEVLGRR